MTTTNLCGKLIFDWEDEELNEYCMLEEGHEGYHSDGEYFYTEEGYMVMPKCARGPLARTRGQQALERGLYLQRRCWY